ncbi:M48 family metalloprotease [Novosphingobium sp. RD2P27]|uniref:M48 family metalloprotease n=1 Tax=Novosphingobium kalidii TaxID=3230299 RepID=A0ABV2D2T7_9SPHN
MGINRRKLALRVTAAMAMTSLVACGATGGSGPVQAAPRAGATTDAIAISQADKAQGAKAHPDLLAEFGGAVTGPQANYVETVGKNIAVQSGLSNARGDFTVTLLNSPINNAFAVPGGYVYVTRQLAALMNNEAELAGVLGHEVGHVAARHSAKRQKAATRNSILGALGSVLSGVLLGDSSFGQLGQQVFSQGSQLLTLQFSRSQELEADQLGIAYLRRAGYDPRAMSSVLESLARQNALEAQLRGSTNQVPEWASTHPDPASRVRDALRTAGANATGLTKRDAFLSGINGLVYGDDPRQGIVDGNMFKHPELRFAFEAPQGFYLVNGTRSVSINGQSGKAEFAGGRIEGNLDSYVGKVFASLTNASQSNLTPQTLQSTTVNGLPVRYATARAQGSSGPVDVTVFASDFGGGQAYHFVAITQAGNAGVFNPMFRSVRRISASEAGEIRPRRVSVVTVGAGDTLRSLASRMAYRDAQLERFLVLNGLQSDARLTPGQKVKIVTY